MRLILRWIINALAIMLVAYYVPGIYVRGFYAALIAALVLALVNAVIRPLIILLTLPINILTLGFFTFVVNGLMFWLVGSIVKGIEISSFRAAFFGALLISLISWLTSSLFKEA